MSENWRIQRLIDMYNAEEPDEFVLFALAKEYAVINDQQQSLHYFHSLRTLNPQYVGLYYHLAKLYEEMDMPEEALATYLEGEAVATQLKDHHALAELKNARLNFEMEL